MKWIDELPTPAILVDLPRLEANIRTVQARADAQGVALRPHTKTHKSVHIARMQLAAGARGLTVAKLGEAEVFADAGLTDVRLAYPLIGDDKLERAVALGRRIRLSFCVDTLKGAEVASHIFSSHGQTAEVLLEVDCGYGRCGVRWDDDEAVDLAQALAALPGVNLVGILTHAGHSYNGPRAGETLEAALRRVMVQERDRMLEAAARLARAGVPGVVPGAFEISVGSTPSMRYFENAEHEGFTVTEIRPGNYVFHDAIQVALGVATWSECALTVQATVISRHRNDDGSERVFLDAGKKAFTSDRVPENGLHGTLVYNPRVMEPLPHARLHGLSEEHGWVLIPGGSTLEVGDRVRVVPAHSCVVVNMRDEMYLVNGEEVVETIPVDSRGMLA